METFSFIVKKKKKGKVGDEEIYTPAFDIEDTGAQRTSVYGRKCLN